MYIATAFSMGQKPQELHKVDVSKGTFTSKVDGQPHLIDANVWLGSAAEHYGLSQNIKDYVLVPVPAMVTCLPNTNGDSVSLQEFTRWNPEQARMAYKTWEGRPMYVEHQHKPEWVRGLILSTFLRATPFKDIYKLVMLGALDRTRDPQRVNAVISGELNTYSMGMFYDSYRCSICGHQAGNGIGRPCVHTKPGKPTYRSTSGKLVYRRCELITGFELSLLEYQGGRSGVDGVKVGMGDPSYVCAIGNGVMLP